MFLSLQTSRDTSRVCLLKFTIVQMMPLLVASLIGLIRNETNRCTIISQLFLSGNNSSTCFGQFFCPSSGAYQPYAGTGTICAEISEVNKGHWCVCECRAVVATNKQLGNYGASVGFIPKQSITMHGHTILKFTNWSFVFLLKLLY